MVVEQYDDEVDPFGHRGRQLGRPDRDLAAEILDFSDRTLKIGVNILAFVVIQPAAH